MIILTVVTLLFCGLILSNIFEDFYFDIRQKEMINEGQQLITLILNGANPSELLDISKFINAYAVVVDRQGLIQATSNLLKFRGLTIESSEFGEILKGNIIVDKGFVSQFNASMLTVGLPIKTEAGVIGGLILYAPMAPIQDTIWQIRRFISFAAAGAVLVATGLSFFLSMTITKPLLQIKQVAEGMARGDFESKVLTVAEDEIGSLADSINFLSEALKNNINALSQERDQLQNILLGMTDGVITFDANGRVLIANPQAEDMLGGIFCEDKHPQTLEVILPLYRKVLEEKKATQEEIKIGGKTISARFAPLMDKDNQIWGVVVLLQDITQTRKLEHLRKEFISNVSHELRTPLSYLQGFTEAILDGVIQEPEEKEKYLNIILEETLRLRRLVNELLDLSQMESGNFTLKKEKISLNNLIERVVKKAGPYAAKKQIKINYQLQDIPLVMADEDRIQQVLINLIDNAIKHTGYGNEILVHSKSYAEGVAVSVKDHGPGIPEDEIDFIWERFYKVDKSRARDKGGTGLGLAIVKNIINAHGGKVEARNCPEGGIEFSFYLPL